jgi:hypothetical protein
MAPVVAVSDLARDMNLVTEFGQDTGMDRERLATWR